METDETMRPESPLARDLEDIFSQTAGLWEEVRGKRLFITGGTGFFGRWLLESFLLANELLDLRACAVVLTRDLESFKKSMPHIVRNPAIRFHPGDVTTFDFPEGEFSHVIHAAATSAVETFRGQDPLVKFETVVNGTRRTLEFALRCKAGKFLLTSSGAVYGKQPPEVPLISEAHTGAPDPTDVNSVWGESKRAAELLCACHYNRYGLGTKIARCFSFVGPHLQLDIHYAIGNFIRDGLNGGPIVVKGDGSPYRSYLYASDLAVWLWTILFKGEPCRPYNVGSEESISISELARTVAERFESAPAVEIALRRRRDEPADRYAPSTQRAREELGVRQTVALNEAVSRTISWAEADRSL